MTDKNFMEGLGHIYTAHPKLVELLDAVVSEAESLGWVVAVGDLSDEKNIKESLKEAVKSLEEYLKKESTND